MSKIKFPMVLIILYLSNNIFGPEIPTFIIDNNKITNSDLKKYDTINRANPVIRSKKYK